MNEEIFKNFKNLELEFNTAKDAYSLLEMIFIEIGPYRDGKVSDETWYKVRKFFHFDDSE